MDEERQTLLVVQGCFANTTCCDLHRTPKNEKAETAGQKPRRLWLETRTRSERSGGNLVCRQLRSRERLINVCQQTNIACTTG